MRNSTIGIGMSSVSQRGSVDSMADGQGVLTFPNSGCRQRKFPLLRGGQVFPSERARASAAAEICEPKSLRLLERQHQKAQV